MSGIAYDFDATQYTPQQSSGAHPVGKFPFEITGVEAKPSKEGGNGYVAITFSTPAGSIIKRYNFWNLSQQAVDIAHKEMSALCHAIGVFRWSLRDGGAALMRARGMIEVAPQVDRNTGQPNGYNEVKMVFDAAGNDPTKPLTQQPSAGHAQQPPFAQQHPQHQGFPVETAPAPGQPQPGQGWATPQQAPATQAPAPQFGQSQAPAGAPWAAPQQPPQGQPPYGAPAQAPQQAQNPNWAQQGAGQQQAAPSWAQQR